MSDPFIGTIMPWAVSWAPSNWSLCMGQILPVNGNQAVFALIGATYGGNGSTNFALPDLRGRVPVGAGQFPGSGGIPPTTNRVIGQSGGQEQVNLTQSQMPVHTHAAQATGGGGSVTLSAYTGPADSSAPAVGKYLTAAAGDFGGDAVTVKIYGPASGTAVPIASGTVQPPSITVGNAGGTAPVSMMQPWQCINFCFCLQGLWPPRD
ncbi:phage tail protein [Rhodospirillum centenum]|uniref:Phage tail collar domain-containing protein n=1 Tax=Rhodospirillum centenum (strain ATCC 51521 / SW) TaxID=414684 RepID=B6IWH6_RHOCS|nr:tail fiber protein [Rhodospirillum centenum]ACJ00650.1 conserved hypothetical protein [Rhodospirillum centenum SW]